jgi:hypothetical protein
MNEAKKLRSLMKILVDVDVCILNNKFCEAYYWLKQIDIKDLENIIIDLKYSIRNKILDLQGDQKD